MSNITLNDLEHMTPQEVAEFPAALLSDLTNQLKAAQDHLKNIKTVLDAGIDERYSSQAKDQRDSEQKDTGSATLIDGEFTVTANLPKKVTWDQKQLYAIFDKMSPEMAFHYAKVKYEVEEKKFTAAPPDIHAELLPARTLDTGKPTYKFKETE